MVNASTYLLSEITNCSNRFCLYVQNDGPVSKLTALSANDCYRYASSNGDLDVPYDTTNELPDSVKSVLPKHAQEIYMKSFNSSWEQYKDPEKRRDDADREEVAHRVAWSAVKQKYEKGQDGNWHKK